MHDIRDLFDNFKKPESLSDLEEKNSEKAVKDRLEQINIGRETAGDGDLRSQIGQERLLGKNNLMDVSYLAKGMQLAQSVCRIIQVRGTGNSPSDIVAVGSGFMVGENILMTNNHVIDSKFKAKGHMAQFDYEYDPSGNLKATSIFKLDPDTFFVTYDRKGLDYTLVAVSPLVVNDSKKQLAEFGYVDLSSSIGKVLIGESVSIIQHPGGLPKMIAIRDNVVEQMTDKSPYIQYSTDTQKGSSGSLVANDQWDIVALHHKSVGKTNEAGDYLDKKGEVWRRGMNEDLIDWIANQGVLMDFILEDLSKRNLSGEKEKIKDHILRKYSPAAPEDDIQLPV